ncbi:MAG: hypothetical protein J6R57_00575 [Bacteroidales bacterium]|nr:hypothetical protein [Bacteroidales bacterium]
MRKLYTIFAAALVMLAVVSCEKNDVLPDGNNKKVVTLSAFIRKAATKTTLGNQTVDGENVSYPLCWSENDKIAVYNNGRMYEFTIDEEDAGKETGNFTCETEGNFDLSKPIYAIYPCTGVTFESEGAIAKYTIPSTQQYKQNGFADNVAPMIAYSEEGTGLSFTNMFGAVKLQLKGTEKVKSIEVVSMPNANLNGPAVFKVEDSPTIKEWQWLTPDTRSVRLDCGNNGVQLNTTSTTDFMIVLPPYQNTGLAFVISTEENTYYKSMTTTNTISAGEILVMGELDLDKTVNPDVVKATDYSYIENGVYLGEGIKVDNLYWAPVNCGYEKAIGSYKGYTWGKLYQWGRDRGCGYSYDSDASIDGFMSNFTVGENWSNDPCPDGWRVPTKNELQSLKKSLNTQDLEDYKGQKGCWYGSTTTENLIFFQAAGYRDAMTGMGNNRGQSCIYWSSTYDNGFWVLNCKTGVLDRYAYTTALPIRCVKDVNPMPN